MLNPSFSHTDAARFPSVHSVEARHSEPDMGLVKDASDCILAGEAWGTSWAFCGCSELSALVAVVQHMTAQELV